QSGGATGASARSRAHDPLVRSVHGLRGVHVRRRGEEHRSRESAVMRIGVYGIGNVLAHDDVVGPSVARLVDAQWEFDGDVVVEDLGMPAIELPMHLAGFDAVVLVDAVSASLPLGSLRVYDRDEILKYSLGLCLSPHDPALCETLLML